jgi:hypothetical protein
MFRRSRPLLSLADGILNSIQAIRIGLQPGSRYSVRDLDIEEKPAVDLEALDFLEKKNATGFCLRTREDFDWITSFPWVKTGHAGDVRYFFSSLAPVFRNICLKIKDTGGNMTGFLWMVLHGEAMTLPYYARDPGTPPDLTRILNNCLQSNRVSHLTTYQPDVIESFRPGPILGKRTMIQRYFATRDLLKQLPDPESIAFQDGDGDVVFV